MSGSLSVDLASLISTAWTHDAVAGDVAEAAGRLRSSLAGAPWGSDEPGERFGAAHGRNEAQVLAALDALAEVVGSVAGGLRATAATYSSAETATSVP